MTPTRLIALTFALLLSVPALAADAPAPAKPEAVKPAPVAAVATLNPGDMAPDFTLTDIDGVQHSLSKYLADGKIVVLEWFNPDCPFIIKHHKLNTTMNDTFGYFASRGVVWLAINSSAAGKQGAGLERNQAAHKEYGMIFPILMDESGKVGRAYGAKTTPHMFVIGKDGKVVYTGAIDDDPSPTVRGQRNHVINALRAALEGRPAPEPSTKPYGCSVKYAN